MPEIKTATWHFECGQRIEFSSVSELAEALEPILGRVHRAELETMRDVMTQLEARDHVKLIDGIIGDIDKQAERPIFATPDRATGYGANHDWLATVSPKKRRNQGRDVWKSVALPALKNLRAERDIVARRREAMKKARVTLTQARAERLPASWVSDAYTMYRESLEFYRDSCGFFNKEKLHARVSISPRFGSARKHRERFLRELDAIRID